MKKAVIFLLFLSLIASVSAIGSTLKSEYRTGETLIASFSGLTELKTENILFYSGRAYTPLVYDLAKIQDSYYLYALLPFEEKNLTLKLLQAKFIEQGQEVTRDLVYNFLVKGNISAFSVNPGWVITNDDFKINIQNYDKPTAVSTSFLGTTNQYSLIIGEEKTLTFPVGKNSSLEFLTVSGGDTSYSIPVAIFKNESQAPKTKFFKFTKSFINLTVLKDSPLLYEIYIINTGDEDIQNLELYSSSESITLAPTRVSLLPSGEIIAINLTMTLDESKNVTITAESDNDTIETFLLIQVTESKEIFQQIVNDTPQVYQQTETCSSLNGRICLATESCSLPEKLTIDGLCCLGYCQVASSGSSTWLYIVIIVVVLALIGFFVYKRLKFKSKFGFQLPPNLNPR
ncbi:MAG: hypothetical protein NT076_04880 [Candidatus Pacearchaeota archaeon]|nr:hypothetical protein [Candidatus Pacearchaeota archaeon]